MKKQILFLLSSVLFIGISCSEKSSKIEEKTKSTTTVQSEVKPTQKFNITEVKSDRSNVAVENKAQNKTIKTVANTVPAEIDNLRKKHEAY